MLREAFASVHGAVHMAYQWTLHAIFCIRTRHVGWPTVNRKTGEFIREQEPLMRKIRALILFNPLLAWFDRTKMMRRKMHNSTTESKLREESPQTKEDIPNFIEKYHINMDDFEPSDWTQFESFQDFFIRHHKPGARPIAAPDDSSVAVISADCRITVFNSVAETQRLWIKGHWWSLAKLIHDAEKARGWADGAVACLRLSPQDYHRYHAPVAGTVAWWTRAAGEYYGVDPLAVTSDVDVLGENARCCVCIDTAAFGRVLFVAIGADAVGTVKLSEKAMTPGSAIEKGDELGIFEFGGSSIIVAFERGRIVFDQDLLKWSAQRIMVDVEVGMRLGIADKKFQ